MISAMPRKWTCSECEGSDGQMDPPDELPRGDPHQTGWWGAEGDPETLPQ